MYVFKTYKYVYQLSGYLGSDGHVFVPRYYIIIVFVGMSWHKIVERKEGLCPAVG